MYSNILNEESIVLICPINDKEVKEIVIAIRIFDKKELILLKIIKLYENSIKLLKK